MSQSTTIRRWYDFVAVPTHVQAAANELELALRPLREPPVTTEEASIALSKAITYCAEIAAPFAEASKYFGGLPALYDLFLNVKKAKIELYGDPSNPSGPIEPLGYITPGTAKNIMDAALGIIPAVKVLERFLGFTTEAVKLASSGSTVTGSDEFSEAAAGLLNSAVGSNIDAVNTYQQFIDNPEAYKNFANYDPQTVFLEVLNKANLPARISNAAQGDAWSQLFLINQRPPTAAELAAFTPETRPLLFWQQSAALYKAEVLEDFFGESTWMRESAEFLHGIYKSVDGDGVDSHAVGVPWGNPEVWFLPNVLFGTDSDSASIFFKNTYWGNEGSNVFRAGSKGDLLHGFGGHDELDGLGDNDHVYGDAGDDVVSGGRGADHLFGGSGNDWLGYKGRSQTAIYADEVESDGNHYDGGLDSDHILGTRSTDTYVFRKGDGIDHVVTNGGADELQLLASADLGNGTTAQISEAQVSFKREGLDLLVCINREDGTVGDYVRIAAWFDTGESANALGSVTLRQSVDGPVLRTWSKEEIQGLALNAIGSDTSDSLTGLAHYRNVLQGRGGDDILVGANGPVSSTALGDTFIGGADNDQMTGSGSGDTYIYFRGDGHDTILEQDVVLPPHNRTRPMRSLTPARRCGPVVVDDA